MNNEVIIWNLDAGVFPLDSIGFPSVGHDGSPEKRHKVG